MPIRRQEWYEHPSIPDETTQPLVTESPPTHISNLPPSSIAAPVPVTGNGQLTQQGESWVTIAERSQLADIEERMRMEARRIRSESVPRNTVTERPRLSYDDLISRPKKKNKTSKQKNFNGKIVCLTRNYVYKDVTVEKGAKLVVQSQYGKGIYAIAMNSKKEETVIPIPFSNIKIMPEKKSDKCDPGFGFGAYTWNTSTFQTVTSGSSVQGGNTLIQSEDNNYIVDVQIPGFGVRPMNFNPVTRDLLDLSTGFSFWIGEALRIDNQRARTTHLTNDINELFINAFNSR